MIFSTITQWSAEVLFENIRLVLIFAIVIMGMYNLLNVNIGGKVFDWIGKISSVLTYIIGGIVIVDAVLCIVDFFKGLSGGINGWDIVTLVLNIIIFTSLVLGVINAEKLFDLFLNIFNLNSVAETYSFSNKLLIGFMAYAAVDLVLAVPINLLSNIADIAENDL